MPRASAPTSTAHTLPGRASTSTTARALRDRRRLERLVRGPPSRGVPPVATPPSIPHRGHPLSAQRRHRHVKASIRVPRIRPVKLASRRSWDLRASTSWTSPAALATMLPTTRPQPSACACRRHRDDRLPRRRRASPAPAAAHAVRHRPPPPSCPRRRPTPSPEEIHEQDRPSMLKSTPFADVPSTRSTPRRLDSYCAASARIATRFASSPANRARRRRLRLLAAAACMPDVVRSVELRRAAPWILSRARRRSASRRRHNRWAGFKALRAVDETSPPPLRPITSREAKNPTVFSELAPGSKTSLKQSSASLRRRCAPPDAPLADVPSLASGEPHHRISPRVSSCCPTISSPPQAPVPHDQRAARHLADHAAAHRVDESRDELLAVAPTASRPSDESCSGRVRDTQGQPAAKTMTSEAASLVLARAHPGRRAEPASSRFAKPPFETHHRRVLGASSPLLGQLTRLAPSQLQRAHRYRVAVDQTISQPLPTTSLSDAPRPQATDRSSSRGDATMARARRDDDLDRSF